MCASSVRALSALSSSEDRKCKFEVVARSMAAQGYARDVYARSAPFYDLFHSDLDYGAEADRLHRLVESRAPGARSLLDVGCGTGRHLVHLRADFEVEGLDISEDLLELARKRLPRVPLHRGDLRAFDLGRRFDVVTCLFSAIGYAQTQDGLASAIRALAAHLSPGGLLLIEPWVPPASGLHFAEAVEDAAAVVSRVGVGRSHDGVFATETHYLVARSDGVEHFSEVHVLGLFELADYENELKSVGLVHDFLPENRGLFACAH